MFAGETIAGMITNLAGFLCGSIFDALGRHFWTPSSAGGDVEASGTKGVELQERPSLAAEQEANQPLNTDRPSDAHSW